jgi:hypothetical protein
MMECWNHGPSETEKKVSRGKNNGQKRITSVILQAKTQSETFG